MKGICAVRNDQLISKESKMKLLNFTVGEDKSLEAEKTRIHCNYAMPEEEANKEAWTLITDP